MHAHYMWYTLKQGNSRRARTLTALCDRVCGKVQHDPLPIVLIKALLYDMMLANVSV